jgi:UDP-N-acetylmuramyl pentapeptide phosphotransferase/UDP-N-acetylglucosamine-1-phosphate transferase
MNSFFTAFIISLLLSFALTPCIAFICRKFGMIDVPSERRINTEPIARGGGMAIVISVTVASVLMCYFSDSFRMHYKILVLSAAIAVLGIVDDKISLKPLVKLSGQVVVAFFTWFWDGVGFSLLYPNLPPAVDCFLTMFWIVGLINAFNLIDGLDGLASGIAFIGVIGMAGALYFCGISPDKIIFHSIFAGALLGFLRYNFNPASVFLGDCGSMYIGFTMALLPLLYLSPESFLVSVGIPLLAMGVPIFDILLAVVRRSLRILCSDILVGSNGIMNADVEHIHHRILRKMKFNQKKTALILYAITFFAVAIGFIAIMLKSKSAGLYLAASMVAVVVIVRSVAGVEFFDAAKVLHKFAHSDKVSSSRFLARFSVLMYICIDSLILITVFFLLSSLSMFSDVAIFGNHWKCCLLYSATTFIMMVCFNVYKTMWSRAQPIDYAVLFVSCLLGPLVASSSMLYMYQVVFSNVVVFSIGFSLASFALLFLLRTIRHLIRDVFYRINHQKISKRSDTVRMLVYGVGLRALAFRRELVRNTLNNNRIVVGIIDDSIAQKGFYIGKTPVFGDFDDIEEIVQRTKASMLVIACTMPEEKIQHVKSVCQKLGLAVSIFKYKEQNI